MIQLVAPVDDYSLIYSMMNQNEPYEVLMKTIITHRHEYFYLIKTTGRMKPMGLADDKLLEDEELLYIDPNFTYKLLSKDEKYRLFWLSQKYVIEVKETNRSIAHILLRR